MGLFSKRPVSQRNVGLETVGIITRSPSSFDFEAVRNGFATTVVAGIRCGECDGEWDDAFRPAGHKDAMCPHCGARNVVYSEWIVL
jgi:hypothetical protein